VAYQSEICLLAYSTKPRNHFLLILEVPHHLDQTISMLIFG
jgi:hypothetical protein